MSYESRNQIFRDGYNALGLFFPNFIPGRIRNEQIYDMFGGFKMERIPNLLRSHINLKSSKGYSSNSFRFGNIPFRKDSQSTSVFHLLILGLLVTQYLGLGVRFIIQLLRLGMFLKMRALRLESNLMETLWV